VRHGFKQGAEQNHRLPAARNFVAQGDRLHLKANRKLASGARVTNGELVAVKSVQAERKN
jgi:predicted RecA/RadA family phage recombinase